MADSDHYAYKLEWFDALADADLFDPAAWVGHTHVTERERQRLAALGLVDVVRVH